MRLPLSKVYRAFSELDRFDDADCQRFVNEVRAQRSSRILRILSYLLIAIFGLAFAFSVPALFARAIGSTSMINQVRFVVAIFSPLAVIIGLPLLYFVRDFVLRRRVRRILNGSCCRKCGYSLIGLGVSSGIQCTECGTVTLVDPSLDHFYVSTSGRLEYAGRGESRNIPSDRQSHLPTAE